MSYVLHTPGHSLPTDTLIMYGIVEQLFRSFYWMDGSVNLTGNNYRIQIDGLKPSAALPQRLQRYLRMHGCGARTASSDKKLLPTAELEYMPSAGKFLRGPGVWRARRYGFCSDCKELASTGLENWALRRGNEYWILSPSRIKLSTLSYFKLKNMPWIELPSAELPPLCACLVGLTLAPSPLPGQGWFLSIYAVERGVQPRSRLGIPIDRIQDFIWYMIRYSPEFIGIIRQLDRIASETGNYSVLARLVDLAMNPKLSLVYDAVRELRSTLEERVNIEHLAGVMLKWVR